MIKFKYAIHKKSNTILTYEQWLKSLKEGNNRINFYKYIDNIFLNNKTEIEKPQIDKYSYDLKDILFSDDFEIIYENEFTEHEYEILLTNTLGTFISEELSSKLENKLNSINNLKYRFGVDE